MTSTHQNTSYFIYVYKNKMDCLQLREFKHLLQQIFTNHKYPFQFLSHIIDGNLNDLLQNNLDIICENEQYWCPYV